jgi:hypothetical protein
VIIDQCLPCVTTETERIFQSLEKLSVKNESSSKSVEQTDLLERRETGTGGDETVVKLKERTFELLLMTLLDFHSLLLLQVQLQKILLDFHPQFHLLILVKKDKWFQESSEVEPVVATESKSLAESSVVTQTEYDDLSQSTQEFKIEIENEILAESSVVETECNFICNY